MAASRLHLASDVDLPLQAHLDEFSLRLGRLLAVLTAGIVASWYWIDPLLQAYLHRLSPCVDCIIVYSPTEWVGLRWLSILLLACLLSMPFAFRELLRFSDPGLMREERDWLRRLLLTGSLFGAGVLGFTLWGLLPALFTSAETAGHIPGVSPRYSAAAMLEVALVVAWIELIITLSTLAAILLSRSGLAAEPQLDIWRFRLHATSILLLWLLVPSGYDGLLASSIIVAVLFAELGFRYSGAAGTAIPRLRIGAGVLDSEARLRRIGIIDCSCAGACPRAGIETLPDHMLGIRAQALCLIGDERDRLIETVAGNRLSDIFIAGCDSTPLPERFRKSLEHLDCSLRGLSMMDIEALRASPASTVGLQLHMLLASETDPWSTESREQRGHKALESVGADSSPRLVFEADVGRLGVTLEADEVFIPSGMEDAS